MQLLKSLIVLFAIVCQCLAFEAQDAHLAFPKSKLRGIMLGTINGNSKKLEDPITIDRLGDSLELGFVVPGTVKPSQVSLLLGLPEKNLEVPFSASLVENQGLNLYKIKLAISKIPNALLHYSRASQRPLQASLLLAGEGSGSIFVPIFDMELNTDDIIEYNEPTRYGSQPEIRHIFNPAPTTAPWFMSIIFSSSIIAMTFLLVASWLASGALDLGNVPNGVNSIYFVAFIGSIIGFEYIFTMYYSGSSIFETLNSAMYLGIPSLWIGTKFLRNFGQKL